MSVSPCISLSREREREQKREREEVCVGGGGGVGGEYRRSLEKIACSLGFSYTPVVSQRLAVSRSACPPSFNHVVFLYYNLWCIVLQCVDNRSRTPQLFNLYYTTTYDMILYYENLNFCQIATDDRIWFDDCPCTKGNARSTNKRCSMRKFRALLTNVISTVML